MNKKDIRRAAYHLKQWSDVLNNAYKGGNADSEANSSIAALAEAKEMADLSKKLYALARATNKMPNERNSGAAEGGPAGMEGSTQ